MIHSIKTKKLYPRDMAFYANLNKSSKYALILKVIIGNVDQECYNIVNRFNKNAYLQYIIK